MTSYVRVRSDTTGKSLISIAVAALLSAGILAGFVPAVRAQSTVDVTINNFSFMPGTITVVIGVNNTVTWTNEQTGVPYHTVTADDNSWGSGQLTTGDSYTYTFTAAGTYQYHCSLHTYMKGTVIVLSPSSTSTTSTTSSSSQTSTSTTESVTSSTSSLTSSSSTSTSAPSTTATATSSATTTSNGVPEFPYQGAAVAALTALVLASYLIVRETRKKP